MEEIKTYEETYGENEKHEWYGKKCVRCMREIKTSPIWENIYEGINVDAFLCGKSDCELVVGSEEYKKFFWMSHFVMIFLNPEYWGKGVAEKVWDDLLNFADKTRPCAPDVRKVMRKYNLLTIMRFLKMLA